MKLLKTKTATISESAPDLSMPNLAREINAIQAINTISDLFNQGIVVDHIEDDDLFEFSQRNYAKGSTAVYWQSKTISWETIKDKLLEKVEDRVDSYYQTTKEKSITSTAEIKNLNVGGDSVSVKANEASIFLEKIAYIVNGRSASTGFNWTWNSLWDDKTKKMEPAFPNPLHKNNDNKYTLENAIWRDMLSVSIYLAWLDKKSDYLEQSIFEADQIASNTAHAFCKSNDFIIRKHFTTLQNENSPRETSLNDDQSTVKDNRGDLHNAYMMQIPTGKYISTEFTALINGNLVCYGWLDSSTVVNAKMLPTAWCAIEAQLKDGDDGWEILSVQPVVPAKFITYVSFMIPVRKGLKVRIRTGFPVGGASGRYSSIDVTNSLSNHVPNAFLGAVYGNINLQPK